MIRLKYYVLVIIFLPLFCTSSCKVKAPTDVNTKILVSLKGDEYLDKILQDAAPCILSLVGRQSRSEFNYIYVVSSEVNQCVEIIEGLNYVKGVSIYKKELDKIENTTNSQKSKVKI